MAVGLKKNIFYKKKADTRSYVMFFSTFIAVSVMKNYRRLKVMKRILILIFAIVSVNICIAQDAKYKAMFIYNFTRQIDWPASEKSGDFIICVVNQNEILNYLKTVVNGKMVGTQPITVVGVKSVDEISKCHILYLSFADSKADKLDALVSKLGNSPSLIVTDRPGSLKHGACINFLMMDDVLKFELNKTAATDRKLQVSSQLEGKAYNN